MAYEELDGSPPGMIDVTASRTVVAASLTTRTALLAMRRGVLVRERERAELERLRDGVERLREAAALRAPALRRAFLVAVRARRRAPLAFAETLRRALVPPFRLPLPRDFDEDDLFLAITIDLLKSYLLRVRVVLCGQRM